MLYVCMLSTKLHYESEAVVDTESLEHLPKIDGRGGEYAHYTNGHSTWSCVLVVAFLKGVLVSLVTFLAYWY